MIDTTRPQAGTAASNQYGTFEVVPATANQLRFITRLLAEREHGLVYEQLQDLQHHVADATINHKNASDVIDHLLSCPEVATGPTARLASEKQVALVKRLIAERDVTDTAYPAWEELGVFPTLTSSSASAAIDDLFSRPRRTAARAVASAPVFESGIYNVNGTIFKVYKAQSGTHMLAKELVVDDGEPHFDYRGSAPRFVPAGTARMTLAEAKAFGAIYGVCCQCGATLTDETSIAEGIGPVCGKRFA